MSGGPLESLAVEVLQGSCKGDVRGQSPSWQLHCGFPIL